MITDGNLPYGELEELDIDRVLADNLPRQIKESLRRGEMTPLLEVKLKTDRDVIVILPMKLQMVRDNKGNEVLLGHLVKRNLDEKWAEELGFSPAEIERLKTGDIVSKQLSDRLGYYA